MKIKDFVIEVEKLLNEVIFCEFQDRNGPASPSSPLKSPSKIPSYQPRPSSITPKSRSRSTSKQRLSLKASPDSPAEPTKSKLRD